VKRTSQVIGADRVPSSERHHGKARPRPPGQPRSSAAIVPRFVVPPTDVPNSHSPANASNAPDLLYTYATESRDPAWAPTMESALANSLQSRDVFMGLRLREMSVTGISCRQRTCRMTFEYPTRLVDTIGASGPPPTSLSALFGEPLGGAPNRARLEIIPFDRQGESMRRVSLVLGFDEER
jgi:hypothetical protein